jgi:hypothetical protein
MILVQVSFTVPSCTKGQVGRRTAAICAKIPTQAKPAWMGISVDVAIFTAAAGGDSSKNPTQAKAG